MGEPEDDGWYPVVLRGWSVETLARSLAGFGDTIEVVDPPEATDELARIGAQLVARYEK